MAQFLWKGEIARPGLVQSYGPTTKITVPKKDGSYTVVTDGTGFVIDDVIAQSGTPVEFTDERSLRTLRADPRYEEVV